MYSATKQESVPNTNDFLIDSGAATFGMSSEFGRQPGGKPRGPEVELRSATRHQFTFTLHPRTVDCKGRLSQWDKCATEAISSRSAVLLTVNH